jgi:tryptophan synthase alpha chain
VKGPARGPRAVREAFDRAAAEDRAALIVYLMAGYPDQATSLAAAEAALDAGADLLEIGIPFSDPVADGPVIAAAGHEAVSAGRGFDSAVLVGRALRDAGREQPLLAMGYLNPVVARGSATACRELADAGFDGLIVPDLPAGEDRQLERQVAAAGLALSLLVTPNTPADRLELAIGGSTGFLYVVPLFGVTGARQEVAATTRPLLEAARERAAGRVPVAVGFGVSRPEHVAELAPVADGIIVGSAVVAALRDGGPAQVGELVEGLAGATGRATARSA